MGTDFEISNCTARSEIFGEELLVRSRDASKLQTGKELPRWSIRGVGLIG